MASTHVANSQEPSPPHYDFPFGIPSLLIPKIPPEHLRLRHDSLIPYPPSRPLPHSVKSAQKPVASPQKAIAAANRRTTPVNYDFPFGVPALLIPITGEPYKPPLPAGRPDGAAAGQPLPWRQPFELSTDAKPLPPLVQGLASEVEPFSLEREQYRRVHVLSCNIRSSYIAHALSHAPKRPEVPFLVKSKSTWLTEGSQINVLREGVLYPSAGILPEHYTSRHARTTEEPGMIKQLIVTARPSVLLKFLAPLQPRIDDKTVVCLVNDGLGVTEYLDAKLFKKPERRPVYVLGHMTHQLRHLRREVLNQRYYCLFSLGEDPEPGQLHLSAYLRDSAKHPGLGFHPPLETHVHMQHFLRVMAKAPRLHPINRSFGDFLAQKLKDMAFQCVVDPIAALLDCTYGELCRTEQGVAMVEQLLAEICALLLALPELSHRNEAWFRDYVSEGKLRGDVLGRMRTLRPDREPEMRVLIRNGKEIDIDFLTGWFVQRAREIGFRSPTAEIVTSMVKAKYKIKRKEIDSYIRLENQL